MNIIEAIKSGKKFRRKVWDYWAKRNDDFFVHIKWEDILADDYEIEEEKIEITREQALRSLREYCTEGNYFTYDLDKINEFLKSLGFK